MLARLTVFARLLVVLTFLVGMALLSLPPVTEWCTGHLYPPNPAHRARSHGRQTVGTVASPEVPRSGELSYGEHQPSYFVQASHFTQSMDSVPLAEPIDAYIRPVPKNLQTPEQEMAQLEARLQSLGVTYYQMHIAQASPLTYRITAQFERSGVLPTRSQWSITAADPLAAMQQMVEHVESRQLTARP
jgi:hypothetical protein